MSLSVEVLNASTPALLRVTANLAIERRARDFADFFQGNVNVMAQILVRNKVGPHRLPFSRLESVNPNGKEGFAFVQIRGYGTNVLAATK